MDELEWLRLHIEWGADEAVLERRAEPGARPRPAAVPAAPARDREESPARPGPPAAAEAAALAAAASTPDALLAALRGFDGCPLRRTATNLVFRDGDPASRHVIVTDVPGPDEDRAGLPLQGL